MPNSLSPGPKCVKVPVADATKISHGGDYAVYKDEHWVVLDGYVLFYRGIIPQCNSVLRIAQVIRNRLYPICRNSTVRIRLS